MRPSMAFAIGCERDRHCLDFIGRWILFSAPMDWAQKFLPLASVIPFEIEPRRRNRFPY